MLGFALLMVAIIVLLFVLRYVFNKCGGKAPRKKGYAQPELIASRAGVIVFSFILEVCLFYQAFANSDLHSAFKHLSIVFQDESAKMKERHITMINNLPDSLPNPAYSKELFKQDLLFSIDYAINENQGFVYAYKNYEWLRQAMIYIILIVASIACTIGVAAGSILRGFLLIIMEIMIVSSGFFLFILFGYHLAITKSLYDYCGDIEGYVAPEAIRPIPTNLQYFFPCITSPLHSYLYDYFGVKAVEETEKLKAYIPGQLPIWSNVSYYNGKVSQLSQAAKEQYEKAKQASISFEAIDESITCRTSIEVLRQNDFLLCRYAYECSLMITVTQGFSIICIVVLSVLSFSSIKKYQWAGNRSVNTFWRKPARAKRSPPKGFCL